MKLLSIVQFINTLRNTGSTTKKKQLLVQAMPEFIELAKMIVGPTGIKPTYGISNKRYQECLQYMPKSVEDGNSTWTELQPILKYLTFLSTQRGIREEDVDKLITMLEYIDESGKTLVGYILAGSLDAGVSYKLLQNTHPTLFEPDMVPMLASASGNYMFPVIVQPKYDGARALATVSVNNNIVSVSIKSRNGKLYNFKTNDNIITELKQLVSTYVKALPDTGNITLYIDGELSNDVNRQSSNGIATKLVKNTATDLERNAMKFNVWDIVVHNDTRVLEQRYQALLDAYDNNFTSVLLTPSITALSESEITEYLSTLDRELYDGVIVKSPDSLYQFNTRSKQWVKIKDEFECELLCVGTRPGTGKYQGQIGALVCTDSTGKLAVSIGTGLTDADRSLSSEEYTGKIITVKYNKVIPDSSGTGYSLFLPVYVCTRFDKQEPDSVLQLPGV